MSSVTFGNSSPLFARSQSNSNFGIVILEKSFFTQIKQRQSDALAKTNPYQTELLLQGKDTYKEIMRINNSDDGINITRFVALAKLL
jgi:hypothetical protein